MDNARSWPVLKSACAAHKCSNTVLTLEPLPWPCAAPFSHARGAMRGAIRGARRRSRWRAQSTTCGELSRPREETEHDARCDRREGE
eukprot:1110632-Prymnesium_polylepis.1